MTSIMMPCPKSTLQLQHMHKLEECTVSAMSVILSMCFVVVAMSQSGGVASTAGGFSCVSIPEVLVVQLGPV